jgi:hypothetical protein
MPSDELIATYGHPYEKIKELYDNEVARKREQEIPSDSDDE